VSDLSAEGPVIKLRMSGHADMDAVIKQAARYTVRDIHLEQPTLEEIFLTYYGKKEE